MRKSGVLMHITSLPSHYGVGTLEQADKFIDFLVAAKQSYWQILPVTPTDFVNSPYASPSAFAGNTLLVDASSLERDGLVSHQTILRWTEARGNDYGYAIERSQAILKEAFQSFLKSNPPRDYFDFVENNAYWLQDYALFCAIKKHFDGKSWLEWPDEDVRLRKPSALAAYADKLSDDVDYYAFCQYVFDKQWKSFRQKLQKAGVKLIGDIPIYVAYDSADVWAHSELFELTSDRRPSWVAGVPPDYFSADGQLWGNPLYNWEQMKADGYDWWMKRVARCAQLFDVLRIDHFRAFDSYYAIKYGEPTARNGHWRKGVGYDFLSKLIGSQPDLTVIAEDLGDIPHSVLELRDRCGLAGMKVVQFAFDGNPNNSFLPQNFEEHCVAYLGTHDNDTTLGWWNTLSDTDKYRVVNFLHLNGSDHIARRMIGSLAESRAELVVYGMQDVAEQDTTYRMNTPGTLGCWKYMAHDGDFSAENARFLAELTERTGRI